MNGQNIEKLLQRVQAGALDTLTPDEIEALAAALDTHAGYAARAARWSAPPAFGLAAVAAPAEAAWNQVWAAIDEAGAASVAARPAGRGQLGQIAWLRRLRPLVASAACVLLGGAWLGYSAPERYGPRLDADVTIHEMEIYGETSSFVLTDIGDKHISMIMMFDDRS